VEQTNVTIREFNNILPMYDDSVYIDIDASVIGDVTIGKDSSIWPMCAVRGDVHKITIGERTNIQDGSIVHVTADNAFNPGGHPCDIGSDVTIGHGAIIHACKIGNMSLVGMGATILDGAIIEDEVMVAAGSLVSPGKTLTSGFLWLGSPVRKARPLTDKEKEYLQFSAKHYVNLKNQHMQK